MFQDFFDFKNKMKNKEIVVVGIGVSNTPLINMLLDFGAFVTACDKKDKDELGLISVELEEKGVTLKLGKEYLQELKGDYLFKSPGIRFDLEEFREFQKKGGILTSEMEVFFDICPAKIIGITGSDGKTTTTTLLYEMLKDAGYTVHLGGNIGKPLLCDIERMKESDMVVVELSSFQLHTMTKSPHIAVITNITPNHLDIHKSMEEYTLAKENITKYQSKEDLLILNFDNELTKTIGEHANAQVRYFSKNKFLSEGTCLKDGFIYYNGKKALDSSKIKLPGLHNVENYMTAFTAIADFIKIENFENVATNFNGVAHRIEFVREINGVRYYNDSIASSPTRTTACLNAFYESGKKIILIAGGYDKKIPFEGLGEEIARKTKEVYLVGDTAIKISNAVKAVDSKFPITIENSLSSVLNLIRKSAKEGDVVVLSPACASFDLYKNFEERGNLFKELVNQL